MSRKQSRALAVAAGLVGWSFVSPRLPANLHPFANAAVGTALSAWTRSPLGLSPPAVHRGVRTGAAVAAAVTAGIAAGALLPAVRTSMYDRRLPDGAAGRWLLLRIPLGTAWAEEAAYRGALTTVGVDAFGPTGGRLLQSAAFGLSHIADARAAGEPVVRTVVVTAVAGWVFAALAERSGSLAAPLLAHLAVNEAGAVAALLVQRGHC